jgi:transposase
MPGESKRLRRQFSTEQKVAILRRHLVDKVPVSDLCDEYKLQPSVLYQWQRHLFENLAGAFEAAAAGGTSQRERQLAIAEAAGSQWTIGVSLSAKSATTLPTWALKSCSQVADASAGR